MMKRILFLISLLLVTGCLLVRAQVYKFDFTSDKKVKEGYTKVTPETLFNDEQGYGYDLQPAWDGKSNQPFFFSVNVPDGNYKVTVTLVRIQPEILRCVPSPADCLLKIFRLKREK